MSDLVFVADVHLLENDEEAPTFHRFLRSLAGNTHTCVIVGDLFNVWIAKRRFLSPGQGRMLQVLRETARQGVEFKYVEGNRDYFVAENWSGDPFAEVATCSVSEQAGPKRLMVSHGDLVNRADRQYRAWRALSRSLPVRGLLALLPAHTGRRLANSLEARLRNTNRRYKSSLPEDQLRRFATEAFARGHQGVVLGHFHQELKIDLPEGTVWVLPDWKDGRRYLRFGPDGVGRFVSYVTQSSAEESRSSASSYS